MNGWESFKYDITRVLCGINAAVTTSILLLGLAWYFEVFKIACLGKVCAIAFR